MAVNVIEIENKQFAMVPLDIYNNMVEELEDMEDIQQALLIQKQVKNGEMPTYSAEFVHKILSGVNRVKLYRENKGLTQQQLADQIGKSVAMIRKIENGESEASISTMKAIAKVLDTDIDSLV